MIKLKNLLEIQISKPFPAPWKAFEIGQNIEFNHYNNSYSFKGVISDIKFINYKATFNNDGEVENLDILQSNNILNSEAMILEIKPIANSLHTNVSYIKEPLTNPTTFMFINPNNNPKNWKNIQANNLKLYNCFKILK